jgi:hypothetical protein
MTQGMPPMCSSAETSRLSAGILYLPRSFLGVSGREVEASWDERGAGAAFFLEQEMSDALTGGPGQGDVLPVLCWWHNFFGWYPPWVPWRCQGDGWQSSMSQPSLLDGKLCLSWLLMCQLHMLVIVAGTSSRNLLCIVSRPVPAMQTFCAG